MFWARSKTLSCCFFGAAATLWAGLLSPGLACRALAQSPSGKSPAAPEVAAVLRAASEPLSPAATPTTPHAGGYDLPFGGNPYWPSEAKADFRGFLSPDQIPTAAYCGRCHQGAHAQWRQSAHANSFRTPWYMKNVNDLAAAKGVAYTRHCEGCHNPSALFTGALTTGSKVPRPHDEDGITCMACHSISRLQNTKGIGSYVMGIPAVLLDSTGNPVAGLPADAEIYAHLDRHRAAVMKPFYRTSEYCGVCHKAAMPQMLNGYKWIRTFSTYDEWQQSSWSDETPLPFYKKPKAVTCQECHMGREPTPGAPHNSAFSHRFLGADMAVAVQYGFDEQAKRLVDFLRDETLKVDIFGITVEHAPSAGSQMEAAKFTPGALVAPLGMKPFTLVPGDCLRVDVVVRNKGIGHALIPELRDFYDAWLDFEAVDDSGKVIYRSGAVDPVTHVVDPNAHSYTTRIVTRDGKPIDHHEVWNIYTRAYDSTIQPGRSEVVRYRFQVPPASKGLKLSASVRYRRFRREFLNYVFNDGAGSPDRFPTTTLATSTFHIQQGVNQPLREEAIPLDQTELLRWNNYGIGMLDRQQYAEAVDAFQHVLRVDPKYQRGYTNVAIAEYMRGRYDESLRWIDRALAMDGSDARALYYRGLNLRWQQKYDQAIAALEPVAKQYPRFRQVHQELGYIYMTVRRYQESRKEYEAVLAIDPDDALAHRWLGPVLAALGDKAGAVREAGLAAQVNPDTAAGWTAQRFWREHLDVAHQAMPWHTYSDQNKMDDADVQRVLNLQNPPSYIWIENY